nr:retrovirus-related Pol polyprotein from transposon TNT 1-94 [Tanacetum cinerariifolium]
VNNTAKTRRPQHRSTTKNDKVPSVSKSSCNKNKDVKVEDHHRNLLLSKKHVSSEYNAPTPTNSSSQAADTPNTLQDVDELYQQQHVQQQDDQAQLQPEAVAENVPNAIFDGNMFVNHFAPPYTSQFCDSDLEVAFQRNACFVMNLEGVDLLKGDRSTNLYTINLHEMASASPICLMARASSTKSWLWHQRLSHLNFDTINDLARNDLSQVFRNKYHKEHLCPSCEQGKSKRASHPPNPVPNSRQRLHLLHMDLCGPMRIASINGKRKKQKSISSTKTSSKFEAEITSSSYGFVWTNENCQYKWQAVRSVKQRNRTLVEVARTMLIFSRAPLFLWAEAIATACFTQNRSIIHRRFNKTPCELINGKKPDILFLYVFGALCYPKNDREDIGKLGAKGDFGFFIRYSADSCAYRVYNRRTKKIIETMNVSFDELSVMAFKQRSSKPGLQSMTSGHISSGLDLTYAPSTITTQQPSEGELDLLFEAMYDDYIGGLPTSMMKNKRSPETSLVWSLEGIAKRKELISKNPSLQLL